MTDNCAKQETKQHCEGKIGETKRGGKGGEKKDRESAPTLIVRTKKEANYHSKVKSGEKAKKKVKIGGKGNKRKKKTNN